MPPAGGIPLALQIAMKPRPVLFDHVVAHPASVDENDHDLKTDDGEDLRSVISQLPLGPVSGSWVSHVAEKTGPGER